MWNKKEIHCGASPFDDKFLIIGADSWVPKSIIFKKIINILSRKVQNWWKTFPGFRRVKYQQIILHHFSLKRYLFFLA